VLWTDAARSAEAARFPMLRQQRVTDDKPCLSLADFVAPIESGERVVALLYADNLPGGERIGDTSALEVVLHEAGLALERAVLERALAEAEGA